MIEAASAEKKNYLNTPAPAIALAALATPLQAMRAEFYDLAVTSQGWFDYVYGHGLDLNAIEAHAGALGICRTCYYHNRRFDFSEDGELSAVIEVFADDDASVIDLLAWPIHRPQGFATAFGYADGLGTARVRNPASYVAGRPLQVHRTPLAWLQAGCQGCVIINELSVSRWLSVALGRIAGEDAEHARELGRLLHPLFDLRQVVFPIREAA